MSFSASELETRLQPLIGLRVAQIYNAADLRGFRFVRPYETADGCSEWFLHVNCPWRLEGQGEIITGSLDWWKEGGKGDSLSEEWDPNKGGSLQDGILRTLLDDEPGTNGTIWNHTGLLVAVAIRADEYGGVDIDFMDGYRLVVFPATSRGEAWRIFSSNEDDGYFVAEIDKLRDH